MREPIAIVGMACIFPQARHLQQFWSNIVNKKSAIQTISPLRQSKIYFDPHSERVDRFYTNQGAFIDEYAYFNPLRFGIMPIAAQGAEPDQLLALQTAADALIDAGYEHRSFPKENTQVILGRGAYIGAGMTQLNLHVRTAQQLIHTLSQLMTLDHSKQEQIYQAFTQQLGHYAADSAIGLVPNLCASRIANRFNLGGAAYTVDAACASALLAVDHGINALQSGQADVVLAGGVHVVQDITFWSVFSQLGALSKQQKIMPFSSQADGLLIGEGVGVIVLKRLQDAIRDGDRIYANIIGSGISSDGQGASLMSPDQQGQVQALQKAWDGLDRADIGLIEAHGTATPIGDLTELQTLHQVFGDTIGHRDHHIGLGSIKSMIGHSMPAAGIAGLIKTSLALYHGILPPTLHTEHPHQLLHSSRFKLIEQASYWPIEIPRIAAVNAFGFGGINAHVVVQAPQHLKYSSRPVLAHKKVINTLMTLKASHRDALLWGLKAIAQQKVTPHYVQYTVLENLQGQFRLSTELTQMDLPQFTFRVAILGLNEQKIQKVIQSIQNNKGRKGRDGLWITLGNPILHSTHQEYQVAFMYPGIEASFQPQIDDACIRTKTRVPQLYNTDHLGAQGVSVIRLEMVLTEILDKMNIEADCIMGHSIGEWAGLLGAGYLQKEAVEHFITELKADDLDIPPVLFLAVGAHKNKVLQVISDLTDLYCSHDNCPHQSIFCGPKKSIILAQERLQKEKLLSQVLPFSSGFHAPYFKPYATALSEHLNTFDIQEPHTPLWSASTVSLYPHTAKQLAQGALQQLSAQHLVEMVRFRELIEKMYEQGVRVFVQVGLGSLSSFVDDTLRGQEYLTIDAHNERKTGIEQLLCTAATLFVAGRDIDIDIWQQAHRDDQKSMLLPLGVPLIDLAQNAHGILNEVSQSLYKTASDVGATLGEMTCPLVADPHITSITDTKFPIIVKLPKEIYQNTPPPPKLPKLLIEWQCQWRIDLQTSPYLIDHCFFRQPKNWSHLIDRFPVVPMTLSLQWVMEQVQLLCLPQWRVIAVQNIRAAKWLEVEPAREITVKVQLQDTLIFKVDILGHLSAEVLVSDHAPKIPMIPIQALDQEEEAVIQAQNIYQDRWMFHGPAYYGIKHLLAVSPYGIRGILYNQGTPGALIDNVGQLFGLWVMLRTSVDRVVMPISIDKVSFFGPPPPIGAELICQVWIESLDKREVKANMCLWYQNQVWATCEGWKDWRFDTPKELWDLMRYPEYQMYSQNLSLINQTPSYQSSRLVWADAVSAVASSREFLVGRCLNTEERNTYRALSKRQQQSWLAGRIAAKDAARAWIWSCKEHEQRAIFPIEIATQVSEQGICYTDHDVIEAHIEGVQVSALQVSIAHKEGTAVALCSQQGQVGVDLEPIITRENSWIDLSFSKQEQLLFKRYILNQEISEDEAWTIAWCVKEAYAKACKLGLHFPKKWVITDLDIRSHKAQINHKEWVYWQIVKHYVLAYIVI